MPVIKFVIATVAMMTLVACGGSGGETGSYTPITTTHSLSGQIQKGPLIFGSRIWVSELDLSLNPTGKTYLTQTKDDLGNFIVSSSVSSNLVELLGMGYYMDELTGSLSISPITLSAIADLSVVRAPVVNILTTLQTPRIKNLILQGKSYTEALTQSRNEVLNSFGIDSAKIDSLQNLFAMSINGTSDQDAALLAATAVLSKMSSNAAAANLSSQAAEMSYFLSRIASEIAGSGVVVTNSINTARQTAAVQIELAAVRSNVETYYASRGVVLSAPRFEEWIDKDGSGILPQRTLPTSGIVPSNVANAEALRVFTSNPMTVSGIGPGVVNRVSIDYSQNFSSDLQSLFIDPGTVIIKNGARVNGRYSTVVDGDVISIQRTSRTFSNTVTSTLRVGATAATWSISTRTPSIVYVSNRNIGGDCGQNASGGGVNPAFYQALPILPQQDLNAKYIAISWYSPLYNLGDSGSAPLSISIYPNSPNGNFPDSVPLITTTQKESFFSPSMVLPLFSGGTITGFGGNQQYFLSSSGVNLSANTPYWVVARFNSQSDLPQQGFSRAPNASGVGSDPYTRKTSPDGLNWLEYIGTGQCTYSSNIPNIWLAD
jgi:hypothetical protein